MDGTRFPVGTDGARFPRDLDLGSLGSSSSLPFFVAAADLALVGFTATGTSIGTPASVPIGRMGPGSAGLPRRFGAGLFAILRSHNVASFGGRPLRLGAGCGTCSGSGDGYLTVAVDAARLRVAAGSDGYLTVSVDSARWGLPRSGASLAGATIVAVDAARLRVAAGSDGYLTVSVDSARLGLPRLGASLGGSIICWITASASFRAWLFARALGALTSAAAGGAGVALLADFARGFFGFVADSGCSIGLFSGSRTGVGSGFIRAMAASALFSRFSAGVDDGLPLRASAALACFSRADERDRALAGGVGTTTGCSGGGASVGAKDTIGCRMSWL